MFKIYFIIFTSFFLFSCSLEDKNEYFYIPKDYKGYIIVLHENYDKKINTKRIFKVDSSGLILTKLPFKNSDGFHDMEIFRYKNSVVNNLETVELGSQLQLCDSCSDKAQSFKEERFFYIAGQNFHNNLLNIDFFYTIYLVTDMNGMLGKSENEIYAIKHKLENYSFAYNSNIPPFENNKVHIDLNKIIITENNNLNNYK